MNRLRLICIVVAVIMSGGLAIAIFRAREPCYQGRSLTEWINQAESIQGKLYVSSGADPSNPDADPDWQAASRAVKLMAPDGIPIMLRWIQAKDSMPKQKLTAWLNMHPSFHLKIKTAPNYHHMAWFGFWLLGNDARPAWPVLKQWTQEQEPERRLWALMCLAWSKPDKEIIMPVLLGLIHDPDAGVKANASWMLHYLHPKDAEAAGVYNMFPRLKSYSTNQTSMNQPHAE